MSVLNFVALSSFLAIPFLIGLIEPW